MRDMFKLLKEYLTNDAMEKKSHLAELVHNTLDYENILYLATEHIVNGIAGSSATMMAIDKLREMLGDDED